MIASENFVPVSVLEAQGSVLTNKYAEGYPGKRYYGGCENVDVAEQLAIDRAKELFGSEHANVQPHAGAQANTAVYHALLNPGESLMGLELSHGGHLTHGMRINVSGKLYEIIPYHVDRETSRIDMDEVERIARERRPKMILAGWSAYPRISTSSASARSPTRSAPTWSSTWPTSLGSSPPGCTPTRCRTPTWSRPRSIRRSAAAAAA